MEHVPGPWAFALLALAVWRAWKIVGDDTILDRPRNWLIDRLGDRFDAFIVCVWCAGWWIAVAFWAAWLLWPNGTLIVSTPLAISGAVGLIGSAWDRISS